MSKSLGSTFARVLEKSSWTGALMAAAVSMASYSLSLRAAAIDYRVVWDSPGKSFKDSMPLGNGDLGINLWTEPNGDVVFLIGKGDAWSENSQLVKLGRVRVAFSPSPFMPGPAFRQSLLPSDGQIELRGTSNAVLRAWVDVNAPVIHLELQSDAPTQLKASVELWRNEARHVKSAKGNWETERGFRETNGNPDGGITIDPDTVFPAKNDRVTWAHRNTRSMFSSLFEVQHLQPMMSNYVDPLLNHTFGVTMKGEGLAASDDRTLQSTKPQKQFRLDLHALSAQTKTVEEWETNLTEVVGKTDTLNMEQARAATTKWWNEFWDRSYIHVSGDADAEKVTQGYAMQRWMTGASGRGASPMKYNGSIFTVGREPDPGAPSDPEKPQDSPDYRAWGSNYWFQNQRLVYWPMLANGDLDTLAPFFKMYVDTLPLQKDRTKLAYGLDDCAIFPETMYYFGLPNNNDFGWDNKTMEMKNHWIRWHYNNALELTMMMLDTYDQTQDDAFARNTLLPLAVPMIQFFDRHWKHVDGKLRFDPSAALETRQAAVDPAPDVAGLMHVLPRLIALPEALTTPEQRGQWYSMLLALPPLARGKTDATGKMPPTPKDAAPDGKDVLWPAANFTRCNNSENPELYSVFPYRLFGVGLPELELARATYEARSNKSSTCWGQDGMDVACLGWAARAKAEVTANFTAYGGERFQWFWKPGHDWEPDLDNGGAGQLILQSMLMQRRADDKILLFPAWPKEWNVSFKLHAPKNTTIECEFHDGKVQKLVVTPAGREKDVVMQPSQ